MHRLSVSLYIHDRDAIARGWRTCGTRKHFLGTQHSLRPQFILFVFFCPTSVLMLWKIGIYTHTHISDYLGNVYDLPLLPKNTGSETFLRRSGAVQSVDNIYHWGASLVVTGPIRDMWQNVLQFSFQTGSSSSSPTYFHSFFLIAFLEEVFVRNT